MFAPCGPFPFKKGFNKAMDPSPFPYSWLQNNFHSKVDNDLMRLVFNMPDEQIFHLAHNIADYASGVVLNPANSLTGPVTPYLSMRPLLSWQNVDSINFPTSTLLYANSATMADPLSELATKFQISNSYSPHQLKHDLALAIFVLIEIRPLVESSGLVLIPPHMTRMGLKSEEYEHLLPTYEDFLKSSVVQEISNTYVSLGGSYGTGSVLAYDHLRDATADLYLSSKHSRWMQPLFQSGVDESLARVILGNSGPQKNMERLSKLVSLQLPGFEVTPSRVADLRETAEWVEWRTILGSTLSEVDLKNQTIEEAREMVTDALIPISQRMDMASNKGFVGTLKKTGMRSIGVGVLSELVGWSLSGDPLNGFIAGLVATGVESTLEAAIDHKSSPAQLGMPFLTLGSSSKIEKPFLLPSPF